MSKITIPFVENTINMPIIEFSIMGNSMIGLIDTGAELTIFDNSIINDLTKEGDMCKMGVVSLNGESPTSTQKVSAVITFSSGKTKLFTKIAGYTSDLSSISEHYHDISKDNKSIIAIFGNDILNKLDAKIDYEHKTITLYI